MFEQGNVALDFTLGEVVDENVGYKAELFELKRRLSILFSGYVAGDM